MDYSKVERDLKDGILVCKAVKVMRSDVWKHFNEVFNATTKEYEGYVVCKRCNSMFAHDKKKSGTSRLSNHAKVCLNDKSSEKVTQPSVRAFFQKTSGLPAKVKMEFSNACIKFVAKDMRAFKAIEGDGLKDVVQQSIAIGAQYENVSASSIIPSRHTVKRKLCEKASNTQLQLAKLVNSAMGKNGLVGCTLDMWTDAKQRHYVGITVHFINEKQFTSAILSVYEFPEQVKSGENIRLSLQKTCSSLGIDMQSLATRFYFVTDQGSNMKSALATHHRLPCACHMIATVIRHILNLDGIMEIELQERNDAHSFAKTICDAIADCKSLVSYMKRSGLNNKLNNTLKQANDTRWNSILTMLESVLMAIEEVRTLLQIHQKEEKLELINITVIEILVKFLQPFKDATKALEGETKPTIHYVFLWYKKLVGLLSTSGTDLPLSQFLSKRGLQFLQEKFLITDMHKLALFFHPKFKAL